MWYYFIFSSKFGCRLTDIAECLNKLRLKIFTPGYVILALKCRRLSMCWEALLQQQLSVPLGAQWNFWCTRSSPISISVLCVLVLPPGLPQALPPDLVHDNRTLEPVCSQRLWLLVLNIKQNPNLFPSHLIGGYTILWFCISVLVSCLLIRNVDFPCASLQSFYWQLKCV